MIKKTSRFKKNVQLLNHRRKIVFIFGLQRKELING